MLLFIFESIGTSELIFIGIIALIFLGPRRMPDLARKLGKIMADLRSTTTEFRQTWEREVNFEEEANALRTGDLPPPLDMDPVARETVNEKPSMPAVRPVDAERFEDLAAAPEQFTEGEPSNDTPVENAADIDPLSDKRTWL